MTPEHKPIICRILRASIDTNRAIVMMAQGVFGELDQTQIAGFAKDLAECAEEIAAASVLLAELGEPYQQETA